MRIIDIAAIAFFAAASAGISTSAIAAAATPAPAVPAASATSAGSGTLTVSFHGVEQTSGAILLAVYDQAGWQSGRPTRVAVVDAVDQATTTFADLPAGRYGVKAFHDLNGNHQLDTNPFGIPTEPFAFSRDAHGDHGPAAFDDAAFDVAAQPVRQSITIR